VVFEQPELDRDGASKAIFFQTREGGTGLLQIVGSAEGTRRVRIRYKLLGPPDDAGVGAINGSLQSPRVFALVPSDSSAHGALEAGDAVSQLRGPGWLP
jgi:hypothetical protein